MTTSSPYIKYDARLALTGDLDESPLLPGSWFITHGLGKPAGGTYTEVEFTDEALGWLVHATRDELVSALEEAVRRVAVDLYGTAWASIYPPDKYEDAIARWGLRRRERVVVTSLEVYA